MKKEKLLLLKTLPVILFESLSKCEWYEIIIAADMGQQQFYSHLHI